MTTTTTATYTKLKSGNWGLRIAGSAAAGQFVTVIKKSGESKTETVGNIIWTGNGTTLAAIGGGDSQFHTRSANLPSSMRRGRGAHPWGS